MSLYLERLLHWAVSISDTNDMFVIRLYSLRRQYHSHVVLHAYDFWRLFFCVLSVYT